MVCQIALAANNNYEHLVLILVQNVLEPIGQLIITALVIDGVAQDADLRAIAEHVRQVVNLFITSRVPDVKRQLVVFVLLVLHVDDLRVVLNGVSAILLLALY